MQISAARYEEIKSLVADIYYEYGITHLPVEPFRLAEKMQFVVHEYGDFDENEQNTICIVSKDGFSYLKKSELRWHIVYNFDALGERTEFTLAHEIGHIVLGHTEQSPEAEDEADAFAQQLLAPEAVSIHLDLQNIYQVCSAFTVSKQCAKACLAHLRVRKARGAIEYSESEKEILRQLKFIG